MTLDWLAQNLELSLTGDRGITAEEWRAFWNRTAAEFSSTNELWYIELVQSTFGCHQVQLGPSSLSAARIASLLPHNTPMNSCASRIFLAHITREQLYSERVAVSFQATEAMSRIDPPANSVASPEGFRKPLSTRDTLITQMHVMDAKERAQLLAELSSEDRAAALMAMTKDQRRDTIAAMPAGLLSQMLHRK